MASYVVYDAVLDGVSIGQLTRSSYDLGGKVFGAHAAGATGRNLIVGDEAEPKATFESADLASVVVGIPVPSGLVTTSSILIPWNQRANGGAFEPGADHFALIGQYGLTVLTQVSAAQGNPATATLETTFISTDGITNPVQPQPSSTLNPGLFNGAFTLGPVDADGVRLKGASSVTVNTGLQTVMERTSGGIYPTQVFLQTPFEPSIDVTFRNVPQAPLDYQGFTSVTAYMRRRGNPALVDPASPEHVAFTLTDGICEPQSMGGNEDDSTDVTLRFHGAALAASASATIAI